MYLSLASIFLSMQLTNVLAPFVLSYTYFKRDMPIRERIEGKDEIKLPSALAEKVDELETTIMLLLLHCSKFGTVKIVTYAGLDWVESACRKLMPHLGRFFVDEEIEVISARSLKSKRMKDKWEPKKRVFIGIVKKHTDIDKVTAKKFKFISVGDSQHERQAALNLKTIIPKDCIKIITLERRPTLSKLKWEIGTLLEGVPKAVESDEFLDDSYGASGATSVSSSD